MLTFVEFEVAHSHRPGHDRAHAGGGISLHIRGYVGLDSGADQGRPLALAVGDAAEDLPMMELARLAMAPANADATVRAARIRVLGQPDQLGFAKAVAKLIGHTRGACRSCKVTHLPARSRLLLTALAAQYARGLGKVLHTFRLAASVAQTTP